MNPAAAAWVKAMGSFKMKVAGAVAQVHPQFDSTLEYFRPYLTEEDADFTVTVYVTNVTAKEHIQRLVGTLA